MSALPIVSPTPVRLRAVLVLLATLLAHAAVLHWLGRALDGSGTLAPIERVAVSARLLPPPPPPVVAARRGPPAAPVAPPPRPRPAPAAKRPPAPPLPPAAPAPAAFPETVDVGADAFGVEPEAAPPPSQKVAEEAATVQEPAASQPSAEPVAAAEPPPFEASGASLQAALAGLVEPQAALPAAARYVYRTTNSELRLASGTSTIEWSLATDGRYRLSLTTTAIGVTVLELHSEGQLRAFGLAPERYTETRVRRGTVAANFDWEGRRVTFSARPHERPLADGVQDRISFQFQLMLLGQAQPERFRAGGQTVLLMASRDDVSSYRFRSTGPAMTATGIGELDTVHIERIADDATDARVEVWLAPSLGWLPAKLRFTDRYGRVTESVLESMPAS